VIASVELIDCASDADALGMGAAHSAKSGAHLAEGLGEIAAGRKLVAIPARAVRMEPADPLPAHSGPILGKTRQTADFLSFLAQRRHTPFVKTHVFRDEEP